MATSKYISDGDKLNYTPGSAVSAGDVIVIGSLVCHAPIDIAASVEGHVQIEGIVRFPKGVLSTDALTQGQPVYWDAGNEVVTATASTHEFAGFVAEAAAAATATVRVKLDHLI